MTARDRVGRIAAAATAGALLLISTAIVAGAGPNAGVARIIDPASTTEQPITSGGSATVFTFRLPAGAACTKDTATFNYHVNSYLLDATAYPDPGSVNYNAEGPVGNGTDEAYPLVDNTGSPYIEAATAQTTGQVINPPLVDLKAFSIDGSNLKQPLPAGAYNIGLACADEARVNDKYWNNQIIVTADVEDPNGLSWVVGPTPTTTTTTTTTTTLGTTTTTLGTTTTTVGSTTTTTTAAVVPDGSAGTPDAAADVLGVSLVAPDSSATLPRTGGGVLVPLLLAAALLYVGYVVVLVSRRRRPVPLTLPLDTPGPEQRGSAGRR